MSTSHKQWIVSEDDLLVALQSGEHDCLMHVMSGLTSITGEPLQWIADLLEGKQEHRKLCSKRLGFAGWENRKRFPLPPKPNLPLFLTEALVSADNAKLASALRTMSALDGEALDIVRRLFKPDYSLKQIFKKRLAFVGWDRGRPADSAFQHAEDSMIRRMLLDRSGLKIEVAVAEVAKAMQVGKPRVWKVHKQILNPPLKPKP
jgi:hypothetical protein